MRVAATAVWPQREVECVVGPSQSLLHRSGGYASRECSLISLRQRRSSRSVLTVSHLRQCCVGEVNRPTIQRQLKLRSFDAMWLVSIGLWFELGRDLHHQGGFGIEGFHQNFGLALCFWPIS